ncbi:MAG: nodulation protein NfeD [Candidatus Marinimicrobia bacterium]|nr:nodulation protein NfeD [Candidatus Neomarinimicrobiota bacterium]
MKMKILYFLFSLTMINASGVYRVPIHDTIDLGLPPFIERSIAEAEKSQADVIIFDINTFGGRVDAATQIKDAILNSKIPTIAFINKRAISAGALISLSCESIYMTGGGTIGAATAVDMQGNKGTEKVISYMREEMASTAEKRGRNTDIAKGMVDEELSFTHLIIDSDSVLVNDLEGRKEGKLITLTTQLALKYKIADGTVDTFDELLIVLGFGETPVQSTSENWSEAFVRFLTNPIVASLLTTFGFLGILFELQSPGWGIPGSFGLACLVLSLGASYIAKLATMSDFIIIIFGMSLLLVEVLVIPGFGVIGIAGIVAILWGFWELLLPDIPVDGEIASQAATGLTIGIIGGLVGMFLLFRLLTKTKFWEELTSPGVQSKEAGYTTTLGLEDSVGKEGIAESDLHPSGWVVLGDEKVFVVSEGEFIDKGQTVKVLSVDGNRVVVRSIKN